MIPRRLVAVGLALLLAFSSLVGAACDAARTLTSTSPSKLGGADSIQLLSFDSDSVEVQTRDPGLGGSIRVRVEGMASGRPVYYVDGVLMGELFGGPVVPAALERAMAGSDGDRRPAAVQVIPAILAALSIWAATQILVYCGGEAYLAYLDHKQDFDFNEQTFENCRDQVIDALVGRLIGSALKLADALQTAVIKIVTWTKIQSLLEAKTFNSALELTENLMTSFFQQLSQVIKSLLVDWWSNRNVSLSGSFSGSGPTWVLPGNCRLTIQHSGTVEVDMTVDLDGAVTGAASVDQTRTVTSALNCAGFPAFRVGSSERDSCCSPSPAISGTTRDLRFQGSHPGNLGAVAKYDLVGSFGGVSITGTFTFTMTSPSLPAYVASFSVTLR